MYGLRLLSLNMFQAELPKVNTIGIRYVEGIIKDTHYGLIIEKKLGVPKNEVYGIDERPEGKIRNKFLFKVTSYERYKDICARFSGSELEIEKGYRVQVEDISSNNTRVFVSKVPFEVSNNMLTKVFEKFGKVNMCVDYNQNYGMYRELKGQGNRIVWMNLNKHIPQQISLKQTLSQLIITYPGQVNTCHSCGLTGHESRACKTPMEQHVNKVDVNLNLGKQNNTRIVSDLTIHFNSSLDRIQFACEKCDYSCDYESILEVHMATHTSEKPFKCNSCEKSFINETELGIHTATHIGEKPFKCNVCGKRFKGKDKLNKLNVHSKIHVGQFRHTIESPNKYKGLNKNKYTKSMNSKVDTEESCEVDSILIANLSLQENPFACSKCTFQFNTMHELNDHFLSHKKGKTFKCTNCDFLTPSENTLKNHQKNDLCERFGCTECDDKFSTKAELTMHMKCHTEEKIIDTFFKNNVDNCSPIMVTTTKSVKRCMSSSPEGRPDTKQRA